MAASPGEVTQLLAQAKGGNEEAPAKLIPIVYKELRGLAGHYMRGERLSHTLQPTALSPRQTQVVEMRYFAGLTVEETAEALGLPTITVKREWAVAKAWLHRELSSRAAS